MLRICDLKTKTKKPSKEVISLAVQSNKLRDVVKIPEGNGKATVEAEVAPGFWGLAGGQQAGGAAG